MLGLIFGVIMAFVSMTVIEELELFRLIIGFLTLNRLLQWLIIVFDPRIVSERIRITLL